MALGQEVPRGARVNWKVLGAIAALVGLGCVALWRGGGEQQLSTLEPAIDLVGQRMPLGKTFQTSALQPMQRRQRAEPLQAQFAKAEKWGFGSTPWEKLAITSIVMNERNNQARDVSMQAEGSTTEAVEETVTPTPLSDVPRQKNEMDEINEELAKVNVRTFKQLEEVRDDVVIKAQDMAGITAPTGFFDPLGLSADLPAGRLLFYREVEIKHGRVAMLASLGFLVGEQFHPLFGGNIDVPSYIAFQATPLQRLWPAVVTAVAIPEIFSIFQFDFIPGSNPKNPEGGAWWSIKPSKRIPGDFGFDPLGLRPQTPDELKEMQNKEINNGRLAMIAAAGMIAQELATGQKLF
eukprot:gnl/TRDRNA2_/TRDRNA2_177387_c0_seq2.p1 gnl/TRDRNA2_/TRDRNA2_177387_c0~~gnl/TRDRNA2_/TRDRNA2_177387_c0_seq2.p1  ORF type:complete len:389 (+),score=84.33 gnl/TRDRNA2_/TRDRNA2_177387_c0_seq2:118-1167(+)